MVGGWLFLLSNPNKCCFPFTGHISWNGRKEGETKRLLKLLKFNFITHNISLEKGKTCQAKITASEVRTLFYLCEFLFWCQEATSFSVRVQIVLLSEDSWRLSFLLCLFFIWFLFYYFIILTLFIIQYPHVF